MPDVHIKNLISSDMNNGTIGSGIDTIDGVRGNCPPCPQQTRNYKVPKSNLGEKHRLCKLQVKVDNICERMGKSGSQMYKNCVIENYGSTYVEKPAPVWQRSQLPDQTMKRRANVWIPRRRVAPGLDHEIPIVSPAKIPRKNSFIVRTREMRNFFALLDEDPVIHDFLLMDSCLRMSDKYILAMVFAYFKRAGYNLREYSRMNFFVALYLANDMEEDEEELKYEVFPWVLGHAWRQRYPAFLRKRDKLWKKMGFRAVVSRRCCEEIMMIDPDHDIWQRDRPEHHAGSVRTYAKDPEDDGYPRGPEASPRTCKLCEKESQYDSASPESTSWYVSSEEDVDSGCENDETTSPHETSFDMQGLKHTLQKDTDVWPLPEE